MCKKVEMKKTKSEVIREEPAQLMSTRVVASVPLSAMLKVGKLIQPTVDIVSVQLEEFDLGEKSWPNPFKAWLSLSKEKFAHGLFRDAVEYESHLNYTKVYFGKLYGQCITVEE